MNDTESQNASIIELTADIVAAYVGNNTVAANVLPNLISSIFGALTGVEAPAATPAEPQAPAVSIKKSIADDFLICLEDGKKFKSLKRHLRSKYAMSPDAYRTKWNLPKSYPMVAPAYAAERSRLAKQIGLGQKGHQAIKAKATATKRAQKANVAKA